MQVFKSLELTERRVCNNIFRFYNLATEDELAQGSDWYIDAHLYARELAARANIDIAAVAGIIAAFSPQTRWDQNKRYAVTFLSNPKAIVKNRVQYLKAKTILKLYEPDAIAEALSTTGKAFKTKAFFWNIYSPFMVRDVTIDRHAIATCIQRPNKVEPLPDAYGQLTQAQYAFFEACYKQVASEINIVPNKLQAINWLVYRRLRELNDHNHDNQFTPYEIF